MVIKRRELVLQATPCVISVEDVSMERPNYMDTCPQSIILATFVSGDFYLTYFLTPCGV
jgi:hypothetical protein